MKTQHGSTPVGKSKNPLDKARHQQDFSKPAQLWQDNRAETLVQRKFQTLSENNPPVIEAKEHWRSQASQAHVPPVQRVRTLDSKARVFEQRDAEEKREFLGKHIKMLEDKGLHDKAEMLKKELQKYPQMEEGEVLFESIGTEQERGTVYALWTPSAHGPYHIFPTNYGNPTEEVNAVLADGKFQFVITAERPTEVLVSKELGHDGIAKSGKVWYAGTVYFEGGALVKWNNDTGHYRTVPEYKDQTAKAPTDDFKSSALPADKFVPIK